MSSGSEVAVRAAKWAGVELDSAQLGLLEVYAAWLVDEAIPAGGLGPREANRIWQRHIADSLVFGVGFEGSAPTEILDVGSGVGLPGIPLAVAFPDAFVTLLDRGGRRTRLLNRAVRILELKNVAVQQGDIFAVADHWHAMAFRGAVTPPEAVGLSSKLLADDGISVLGLSTKPDRPARATELMGVAQGLGLHPELRRVPQSALDAGSWLFIMRRRGANDNST